MIKKFSKLFLVLGVILFIFCTGGCSLKNSGDTSSFIHIEYFYGKKDDVLIDNKITIGIGNSLFNENDEKILFATPTFEAGKKGDAIITTKKLVLINQQETLDFPLEMLESAISVSNTAVQIQSGSRTYYVFLNENEVKYFLSILRWICKRK
mgnify:CR=1 FL=1